MAVSSKLPLPPRIAPETALPSPVVRPKPVKLDFVPNPWQSAAKKKCQSSAHPRRSVRNSTRVGLSLECFVEADREG